MKRSLVIIPAALAIAGMAQAADRKVSDLMYMPKAGGIFYGAEFVLASGEYDAAYQGDVTNGVTTTSKSVQKYETKSLTWNNGFKYSFTDNLQVGLGLNYQFSKKLKNKSGVADDGVTPLTATQLDAETNDKGLKNIELGARYRVMEEAPVSVDVLAGLSLGLGDDEKSTSYTDSVTSKNTARDGKAVEASAINLGAEVGKKHGDFQWKGAVGFAYGFKHDVTYLDKGSTDSIDSAVNTKFEQDTYTDFNLALAGEYHLVSSFALGAKVAADFVGEKKMTYKPAQTTTTAASVTEESHTDITLGFEGKYEITQSILVKLGFDYVMGGEYKQTFNQTATGMVYSDTTKIKERKDMRFVLGMDFSF